MTRTLLAALLLAACSSPDDTRCLAGATVPCTCPSGAGGAQTCLADGASLSPCVCAVGDVSSSADGDGSEGETEVVACECESVELPFQDTLYLTMDLFDIPIAFDIFVTPADSGVDVQLTPLSAEDGSLLGSPNVAGGTLSDGRVDVEFDDIALPGAAVGHNLGFHLRVNFVGCLRSCGTASGRVGNPEPDVGFAGEPWSVEEPRRACPCSNRGPP